MSAQTWTVVATPRERWSLAMMFLHRDLKFKTRESERRLHRARRALGLLAPTEAYLDSPKRSAKYAQDRTTRHRFTVTAENAEFVVSQLEIIEKNSVDALVLEPLIEQLEARADTAGAYDAPTYDAPTYDEAEELPRWKPSQLPVVEDPERLIAVLSETLSVAKDFADFRTKFALALMPMMDVEPAPANGHTPAPPT